MMLTQNDIETQLTQRRLDDEAQQLIIKQLQSQIQALKLQVSDISTQTTTPSASNSLFGIVNTASGTLLVKVAILFNKLATFTLGLLSSADITIYEGAGNTSNLIVGQDFTHKRFRIGYVDGGNQSVLNSFDNGSYTPCNLDASPLAFNSNSAGDISIGTGASKIGFFGGTAIIRQTRAAYTTNSQAGGYSGIATGVGGSPYASVNDLNTLRNAYENIRASYDDLRTKVGNTTLMA